MYFCSKSLGGWTFAFNDYYVLNITRYMNNPNFDKMAQIIDPYGMIHVIDDETNLWCFSFFILKLTSIDMRTRKYSKFKERATSFSYPIVR